MAEIGSLCPLLSAANMRPILVVAYENNIGVVVMNPLGGVRSTEKLMDSLSVFSEPDPEPPAKRIERVMSSVSELKDFCTGCKYGEGCPQEIPTAAINVQ